MPFVTHSHIIRVSALAFTATMIIGCQGIDLEDPDVDDIIGGAGVAIDTAMQYPDFTDADEERLAQENARKFEAENPIWNDKLLEDYLTRITQRIAREAQPQRGFRYRMRVVGEPTVNAFTFGGGLIYIYAGAIARMENEAQLAMLLGHEIAHVKKAHVPNGLQAKYGIGILGTLAAGWASSEETVSDESLQITYGYTMNAAINGHSRSQEHEADELGLDYMLSAGYDPREGPRLFEQFLKEYGDSAPLGNFFYGSHPTNVDRIETTTSLLEKYADDITDRRLSVNTEEFKRRTRELVVKVGILDYERKKFGTAQAMFDKASRVNEDDPIPYYYLGRIALETAPGADAAERAIAHFDKAIAADPQFEDAYRGLGRSFYRKSVNTARDEDRRQAIEAFQQYLELTPDADDAQRVHQYIDELERY